MKILIANNAYQHRGGEDVVVEAEIALLRSYGHDVQIYQRHNDEIKQMSGTAAAAAAVWSAHSIREIGQACERFAPDVIHVHNSFPKNTPTQNKTTTHHNVPVVQTLHNFR